MKAGLALAACLALLGCDGLGRPIVGDRPISDGGEDDSCDLTPVCRPLRAADPSALSVPLERLVPPRFADCDEDGVDDAMDNCPGVANEDQRDVCAAARSACDRLRAGESGVAYTDLRGCRIEEPLAVGAGFSLAGAQLDCASLTLIGPESAQAASLELGQASLRRASLTLESSTPWIADASRGQLRGTFLRLRGGARLRAREAVLADASLVVEPGDARGADPAPAVELTASDVEATTVVEAPSAWAGRVRVERSAVRTTTISAPVVDLVTVSATSASLLASELVGLDVELRTVTVRADYAALSGSHLRDVIFAQCVDVHVVGSQLEDVDVPACEPDRFRLVSSEAIGVNLAGGVHLVETYLGASVVGSGATSVLHTEESELDAVTICDLGAAAFYGGELRCVHCDEDAFMQGTSVCLGGARIFERGCPAIELAPECP